MRIYITGIVASGDSFQKSKEAFSNASKMLNESGYPNVINPIDNLTESDANNYLYGKFSANLKKLIHSDAIYLMSGWWQSTTASIERFTAKTLGKRIIYENEKDKLRLDEIISIVGKAYNVTLADILSPSRVASLVACREHVSHYLSIAGIKHKTIGDAIKRSRSSIVHLLQQYEIDIQTNREFKMRKDIIEKMLYDRGFFQKDQNFIDPF